MSELPNAAPVGPVGGFPARNPNDVPRPVRRSGEEEARGKSRRDGVDVHSAAQVARRLLRERVLHRTRELLELGDGEFVPAFAENVDTEPVGAFLGRLIGAQNQLAALRAQDLRQPELRRRLDRALREGVAEVLELVAGDDDGQVAAAVVADVLAEYARRLADLAP